MTETRLTRDRSCLDTGDRAVEQGVEVGLALVRVQTLGQRSGKAGDHAGVLGQKRVGFVSGSVGETRKAGRGTSRFDVEGSWCGLAGILRGWLLSRCWHEFWSMGPMCP